METISSDDPDCIIQESTIQPFKVSSSVFSKFPALGNLSTKNRRTGFIFLSFKSRQVSLDRLFSGPYLRQEGGIESKTGPVTGLPVEQGFPCPV